METRAMNVVLLPDAPSSELFRAINARIAERTATEIDLNGSDMHPHLSLYNSAFPTDAETDVRGRLASLASSEQSFDVTIDAASMYATYAFADARVTDELRSLHERIVDALNPLRRGATPPVPPGLTPEQEARVGELGMLLAGPAFLPHVTEGHVADVSAHDDVVRIIADGLPTTFKADAIHLVETGPYGTCKRVIESYPFAG
jgi:hypothetical protein